jgi:hypothetical protein
LFRLILPRGVQDAYDSIGFYFGMILVIVLSATGAFNPVFREVGGVFLSVVEASFGYEYMIRFLSAVSS